MKEIGDIAAKNPASPAQTSLRSDLLNHLIKHTRHFSCNYLALRATSWLNLNWLKVAHDPRSQVLLPINLGDEFEIYARPN